MLNRLSIWGWGLAALVLVIPAVAIAGPIEDFVEIWAPGLTGGAQWAELMVFLTATTAWLMAILPQGEEGGVWDKVRSFLNWVAANKGNAQNEKK